MAGPTGAERRQHPRHEATIGVRFKNDGTVATTRDVSRGGCAVIAPRMRLVNERIPLELIAIGHTGTFEVVGEVKRCVNLPDGKFLLGIQFVGVDEALAKKIDGFIAEVSKPPLDDASRLGKNAADAENAGRFEDAIRLLEKALELEPGRGDLVLARARVAFKSGDLRNASKFAKRAMGLDPGNPEIGKLFQQITAKEGLAPSPAAAGAPKASPASGAMPKWALPAVGAAIVVAILLWYLGS